jgi:hypothetical protein
MLVRPIKIVPPAGVQLRHIQFVINWMSCRAMAQAVSSRPLTAEARVRSGSVHVRFVVDKVALRQVFPRVLRFSPVNFIPPVLHYTEKRKKKLIIFITWLHNKPQGCGASVASVAGTFTTKKKILDVFRRQIFTLSHVLLFYYIITSCSY